MRVLPLFAVAAALTAVSAVATADLTRPVARVHVSATSPVSVDVRESLDEPWREACAAPCDQELPIGAELRFRGPGLAPSTRRLEAADGATATFEVRGPSTAGRVVGVGLAATGFAVAGVELFVWFVDSLASGDAHGNAASSYPSEQSTRLAIGGAALAGGLLGAALFAASSTTDVRTPEPRAAREERLPRAQTFAWSVLF